VRQWLRRRRIEAVIPQRSDQITRHRGRPLKLDAASYRRRNVVERCVNWVKELRWPATRYEKLAVNFLAMAKLAIIRRCFRILDWSGRASVTDRRELAADG